MSIIIGLGTGRCGTVSLSHLINAQDESVCFHEINPEGMRWSSTPDVVLSMLREFYDVIDGGHCDLITIDRTSPNRDEPIKRLKKIPKVTTIGEVGFYYLSYVEKIIAKFPDVKFPCLRRDKMQTIQSYVDKMHPRGYKNFCGPLPQQPKSRNHWIEHSGENWILDKKWDKCHPKFTESNLEDALSVYWDSYYREATRLEKIFEQVKIFDLDEMNSPSGQENILNFCDISTPKTINVHENRALK